VSILFEHIEEIRLYLDKHTADRLIKGKIFNILLRSNILILILRVELHSTAAEIVYKNIISESRWKRRYCRSFKDIFFIILSQFSRVGYQAMQI